MSEDGGFWPMEATAGEVVYAPGSVFGPRWQPHVQLVLIHSGHVRVSIDEVLYHAGAKTVFLLFPGHTEHFFFAEECETHHSWIHLLVPHLPEMLETRLKRLEWSLQLSPIMLQLIHEMLTLRVLPSSTAEEQMKALGLQMFWRYLGEGEQHLTPSSTFGNAVIHEALHVINTRLHEPLALETIARQVAVSPSHLIRLFQAHVHATPMEYLWQRRVARGIELLEQTGLSVGEVAERCGFQSRYHFSRRVRQGTGYTPLEVRLRSWREK